MLRIQLRALIEQTDSTRMQVMKRVWARRCQER